METLYIKLILHEIHIAPHKSTLIHSIALETHSIKKYIENIKYGEQQT